MHFFFPLDNRKSVGFVYNLLFLGLRAKNRIQIRGYNCKHAYVNNYLSISYIIGRIVGLYRVETYTVMKPVVHKIAAFFRKEWFLFVMIIAIGVIIFLFSACRLL
jgi:hypothetical protein